MTNMIHCRGCGEIIHETAIACPRCGAQQGLPKNIGNQVDEAAKNGIILLIVSVLFGFFGIHRFMVRKYGTGILMLLTLGGWGIWWIIDIIIIVTGNFTDKEGNKITLS